MTETAGRPPATGHEPSEAEALRVQADVAPVGMVEVARDGSAIWVNERWRRTTGITDEVPISARALLTLVHPDDRDELMMQYLESIEHATEFDADLRIVRGDGAIRHVRLLSAPVVDHDGQVRTFMGTMIDTTELVQAIEARRLSEQRYRELTAKSPVGQAIYSLGDELIEVNATWTTMLGYEPREVIGRPATDLVHPDDRAATRELAESLLAGEQSAGFQQRRMLRSDGTVMWAATSLTLERDVEGEPRHFHAVITDITDSKLAEQRLRDSEARYHQLIDEAPIGQVISRLDGTLVEVNRAFVSLMGSTREELFARPPTDLFHRDDLRPMAAQLDRLLRGEVEHFELERRLVRADGSHVWVSGGTTLIHQSGEVYLHSVMQDITERKLAEAALRDSEERYRAVIEALHDGVLVQGINRIEATNSAAGRLLRRSAAELSRPEVIAQLDATDLEGRPVERDRWPTNTAIRERRPVLDQIVGLLVPGQGRRWFSFNAVPRVADGKVIGAVTTFNDITERKLAEDALRSSEARFRTLTDSLPIGVYEANRDFYVEYVNPRWSEITGMSGQDAVGSRTLSIVHPDDRERIVDELQRSIRGGYAFRSQYRILAPDGQTRWVTAHGVPLYDEGGRIEKFIGSLEDVTPLKSAQDETARLAGIVESTSDLVGIVDYPSGRLLYLNRAGRELLGYGDDDLTGIAHLDLYEDSARRGWGELVVPVLERGETWSGELPMLATDGSVVHVWQTLAVKRDRDGRIYQLSAVGRDVTERRRFEAALAHQATHDALTDLPNRALLLDHLELALARAQRDRSLVGVLFIDLDRFKLVNDSLGHESGDELLVQVASAITETLRPADTVARLGGDEFVVLCESVTDEHHAVSIGQRILSVIEGTPFIVTGASISVTASVGVALSPGGPHAHAEALLRDADAAMYRAKDLGRARLELFDESMRRRAAQRMHVADELALAIEQAYITVHYQPSIDLTTGRVTSVEALARWEHPTRGMLGPAEFITLAEETGLIVGLGLRVLSTACAQARAWQDRLGDDAPRIHVNLSARQLTSANLPELVRGVLESSGLDPARLCLEITESVLMEDAPAVIDRLRHLKGLGLQIAIDDFGTGYSSLSYLRRFPVDILKVDQSFVDGLGPDPEDSAIVAAIIGLAQTLELEAVAEGVETTEQLELLRTLGCTGAQGYLFARPAPAEDVDPVLSSIFPV